MGKRGSRLTAAVLGLAAGFLPQLAKAQAQSSAGPAPLVIDFEGSAGLGFQPSEGWTFGAVRENAPQGRTFARLAHTGPTAAPSQASRSIDAIPYAGQPIRLGAWLRNTGEAVPLAGLWLRIDGQTPGSPLFFDNMADRPVAPGDWARHEIVAYVPQGATRVTFGVIKAGGGNLDVDEIVLSVASPSGEGTMSPEIRAYLDDALDALEARHINRASADWSHLRALASLLAANAQTPVEVYPAIRTVIGLLGERHTLFIGPPRATGGTEARAAALPQGLPRGEMVTPGVGRLTLPALMTNGVDDPAGPAYRDALIAAIATLEAQGACRWVVDLRANGGGNMWPMLNGLEPLLAAGPFGGFGDADRVQSRWVRRDGVVVAETTNTALPPPSPGRWSEAPVAVLFSRGTASSGEMTAIAFMARERTRSFGQLSAGYTTANAPYRLSDGARITITTMGVHDADVGFITGPLTPDEVIEADASDPDATLSRAVTWLDEQPCAGPISTPSPV